MLQGESIEIIRANITHLHDFLERTPDGDLRERAHRLLKEAQAQLVLEFERKSRML
jgi:hypothetical protein